MLNYPQPIPSGGRPLRPGAGTLLTSGSLGDSIAVPQRSAPFIHPFKVQPGAQRVAFLAGVVDGSAEPTINGVPITGRGKPQPWLQLDAKDKNAQGESWVRLEATPNAEGLLTTAEGTVATGAKLELVHGATPKSGNVAIGSMPLVLLLWRGERVSEIRQIQFFNLRFKMVTRTSGPALPTLY